MQIIDFNHSYKLPLYGALADESIFYMYNTALQSARTYLRSTELTATSNFI